MSLFLPQIEARGNRELKAQGSKIKSQKAGMPESWKARRHKT
jgi:hypothetical protein